MRSHATICSKIGLKRATNYCQPEASGNLHPKRTPALSVFILHTRSCSWVWCLPRSTRPSSPGYAPWHLISSSSSLEHDLMMWHQAGCYRKLLQVGNQDSWWNVPLCKNIIVRFVLPRRHQSRNTVKHYKFLLHAKPHPTTGSLAALRINFLSQTSSLSIDSFTSLSFPQRRNMMPKCAE